MGSFKSLVSLYVTHISNNTDRAYYFLRVESSVVFALFLSALLSGYLINIFSYDISLMISMVFIILGCFCLFFLKSSSKYDYNKELNFKNFRKALNSVFEQLKPIKTVFILITIAQFGLPFGIHI